MPKPRIDNHSPNDIAKLLIDVNTSSIRACLQDVNKKLSHLGVYLVALYSSEEKNNNSYSLVEYAGISKPHIRYGNAPFTNNHHVCKINEYIVVIGAKENINPVSLSLFQNIFASKLELAAVAEREMIRKQLVNISYQSHDINSFSYRAASNIGNVLFPCHSVSIYLFDKKRRLFLAGTTDKIISIEKKDIYYESGEENVYTKIANGKDILVEDSTNGFSLASFDKFIYGPDYHSVGFFPVCFSQSRRDAIEKIPALATMGVIKIVNPVRIKEDDKWTSLFTKHDSDICKYISEIAFGIIHPYIQAQDAINMSARLTHGLGSSIDAAIKFADELSSDLFVSDEAGAPSGRLSFEVGDRLAVSSAMQGARANLAELQNYLGDLHFQFEKTQQSLCELVEIKSLHREVLMPLLRMAPRIAAVNSRKEPIISNFRQNNSLLLPSLIGDPGGLLTVFRNLIENSVKYSGYKPAKIDFSFEVDASFVYVDIRDYGMGILEEDELQLFVEGYRSVKARTQGSNRGAGLGLAYSRQAMREMGGDIENIRCDGGALFRVKIARSK